MAARDVIFLRDLLLDLGVIVDAPSVIQSDSKSAIDMSLDPVAFKKTKHILRAAEFLRDLVARDVVRLHERRRACVCMCGRKHGSKFGIEIQIR